MFRGRRDDDPEDRGASREPRRETDARWRSSRASPILSRDWVSEGLKILQKARSRTGIGIVTELMDTDNADAVEDAADIIQIGTRNMQTSACSSAWPKPRAGPLEARHVGDARRWLMAAEYVMAGGNYQVILCERGVRTFSDHSRNTLDLSVIPPAKKLSHLPIVVDPSHGTGKRDYVPAMAWRRSPPAPAACCSKCIRTRITLSPTNRSLDFAGFDRLLESLRKLAGPLERTIE